MASYSAQILINNALVNLGILEQGGTPSVSDSNEALTRLNYMLQQWRIQNKFVPSISSTPYALTATQAIYPIGPAATAPFNVPRPTFIQRASIQLSTGPIVPVRLITQEEYRAITDLTATAAYPQVLYNDRASPASNLYLWPTPTGTPNLILDAWFQLASFATLATTADLPDGYPEAISNALAVRLLSMFGVAVAQPVAEVVSALAKQAEAAIVELNAAARGLQMAPPDAAQAQGQ